MSPDVADRLITANGQAVTLTRRASGTYNTATSTAVITETTQTGKGVILPLSAGVRHSGNTDIPTGTVQCLLSAVGITAPVLDDTLTDTTGADWSIIDVSTLAPAGEALLYELLLKGVP